MLLYLGHALHLDVVAIWEAHASQGDALAGHQAEVGKVLLDLVMQRAKRRVAPLHLRDNFDASFCCQFSLKTGCKCPIGVVEAGPRFDSDDLSNDHQL